MRGIQSLVDFTPKRVFVHGSFFRPACQFSTTVNGAWASIACPVCVCSVTNRQIRFAEAWEQSPSMSYDLTAGIPELSDQDKSKSTGVLYPAAQLVLDKKGQLQWDLNQNPWKLVDVLGWSGTPGVN
jgi:hypothetical protein